MNTDYTDCTDIFLVGNADWDFIGCEAVRVFEHDFTDNTDKILGDADRAWETRIMTLLA